MVKESRDVLHPVNILRDVNIPRAGVNSGVCTQKRSRNISGVCLRSCVLHLAAHEEN